MSELPVISGMKAIKAFSKAGLLPPRQVRRSRCFKKRGLKSYINGPKAQRTKAWAFKKFDKSFRTHGRII